MTNLLYNFLRDVLYTRMHAAFQRIRATHCVTVRLNPHLTVYRQHRSRHLSFVLSARPSLVQQSKVTLAKIERLKNLKGE